MVFLVGLQIFALNESLVKLFYHVSLYGNILKSTEFK